MCLLFGHSIECEFALNACHVIKGVVCYENIRFLYRRTAICIYMTCHISVQPQYTVMSAGK